MAPRCSKRSAPKSPPCANSTSPAAAGAGLARARTAREADTTAEGRAKTGRDGYVGQGRTGRRVCADGDVAAGCRTGGGAAGRPLKFNSPSPPRSYLHPNVFDQWVEAIEKDSGGTLKIEKFYGGTLGNFARHLRSRARRRGRHRLDAERADRRTLQAAGRRGAAVRNQERQRTGARAVGPVRQGRDRRRSSPRSSRSASGRSRTRRSTARSRSARWTT